MPWFVVTLLCYIRSWSDQFGRAVHGEINHFDIIISMKHRTRRAELVFDPNQSTKNSTTLILIRLGFAILGNAPSWRVDHFGCRWWFSGFCFMIFISLLSQTTVISTVGNCANCETKPSHILKFILMSLMLAYILTKSNNRL